MVLVQDSNGQAFALCLARAMLIRISVFYFLFFCGTLLADQNCSAANDDKIIVVVSPQKTGTHLITKALSILLNKKVIHWWSDDLPDQKLRDMLMTCKDGNVFLHTHAYPLPHILKLLEEVDAKVIFLMRDPRDQIVSLMYWVKEKNWPGGPDPLIRATQHYSQDELLYELITGENFGVSYTKTLIGCRLPWMDQPFVYTTYFEKLVGEKGGGDFDSQCQELKVIMSFLGQEQPDHIINECAENLFGGDDSWTFRQGLIGSWKWHFNQKHVEAFKKIFGQELISLGYESDFNWSSNQTSNWEQKKT
ncbi:MAG: sulfotransferase domain-containing protein [Chlamydiales bacterium]|nr:sulfotransferase domain-containing protein [Chlamydiales bacterium]